MKKRVDLSILPLLLVILIPLGLVIYAYWYYNQPAPTQSSGPVTNHAIPPQPIATISLNNPTSLPATTAAGAFVPFSFTIKNTSAVAGDIPYKVSVQWSTGEEDVIDVNAVTLAPGASKTISEQLKFETANETAHLSLQLTRSGQTVRFTIPNVK